MNTKMKTVTIFITDNEESSFEEACRDLNLHYDNLGQHKGYSNYAIMFNDPTELFSLGRISIIYQMK